MGGGVCLYYRLFIMYICCRILSYYITITSIEMFCTEHFECIFLQTSNVISVIYFQYYWGVFFVLLNRCMLLLFSGLCQLTEPKHVNSTKTGEGGGAMTNA